MSICEKELLTRRCEPVRATTDLKEVACRAILLRWIQAAVALDSRTSSFLWSFDWLIDQE